MLNLDFAGDRSSCEVLPSISVTKIKNLTQTKLVYMVCIYTRPGANSSGCWCRQFAFTRVSAPSKYAIASCILLFPLRVYRPARCEFVKMHKRDLDIGKKSARRSSTKRLRQCV